MDAATFTPAYSSLLGIIILLAVKLLKYLYRAVMHVKKSKCVGKVGSAEGKVVIQSDAGDSSDREDKKKHGCKNQ